MAASDDILDDYRKLHAQMLGDIRRWRANGWRLRKDDEDITEKWLAYQRRRADDLARIILAQEKRDVLRAGRRQASPHRVQLLELMSVPKRLIEVDERTAIALEASAGERGLSVSALLAEMARITTSHDVLSADDVAELDRR